MAIKLLLGKRALTTAFIVVLIISLLTFGIMLLTFNTFPGKEIIDRQICYQSVLLRNSPLFSNIAPLRCKTQDITVDYRDEETAKKRVVNAMYDCWTMLGEGKLNPFIEGTAKELGFWPAKSSCVICSTIEFGSRTKEKYKTIDIDSYIKNTKIPFKDKTYLEYFTDEDGKELASVLDKDNKVDPLSTDKKYAVIFFGFESELVRDIFLKDLGLAAGAAAGSYALMGGSLTGKMAKNLFEVGSRRIEGVIGFHGIPSRTVLVGMGKFVIPALILAVLTQAGVAKYGQYIAAGYCNGEAEGCYQVALAEYDKEGLEKTCGTIESIP